MPQQLFRSSKSKIKQHSQRCSPILGEQTLNSFGLNSNLTNCLRRLLPKELAVHCQPARTFDTGSPNGISTSNQTGTLPKFNSSPLKSYRAPIEKDRLPSIILQGRAVKLWGVKMGKLAVAAGAMNTNPPFETVSNVYPTKQERFGKENRS